MNTNTREITRLSVYIHERKMTHKIANTHTKIHIDVLKL